MDQEVPQSSYELVRRLEASECTKPKGDVVDQMPFPTCTALPSCCSPASSLAPLTSRNLVRCRAPYRLCRAAGADAPSAAPPDACEDALRSAARLTMPWGNDMIRQQGGGCSSQKRIDLRAMHMLLCKRCFRLGARSKAGVLVQSSEMHQRYFPRTHQHKARFGQTCK